MIDKKQAPQKISAGQVEHIAKLAKMNLTEKEKEKFSAELSSILDYIDKLNQVDTSNIELINQKTGLNNVARDDIEVRNQNIEIRRKILEQAPKKREDYFEVPKIFE